LTNVAPGRARVRSPNTLDSYRWVIGKYLRPALCPKRLAALTVDDVEALLRSMARRRLSRSSAVRVRAVLVLALTHAERRDLVLRNVARLAEIPAGCAEPKEGRSLSVEQARLLLRAAEGDRYEPLYLCGLMLALRPGELCGLLWEDVDRERATLQVRRSLKTERTGLRLGEPKTRRSYRGLDLPPAVVAALRAHPARQAQERLFAGRAWVDHGLVFTSHVGTPVDPANLRRSFSALTRSVGLGHWTPKELRHSAASLLSAAGVPLELIADVMGHDGTRMTGTVYRHAVRPTVSAGAEAMQRLFPA
jgi:integrase